MNPTLAKDLAAIAPHITWAAGYDSRVEASTHMVIDGIVLGLVVRSSPKYHWVMAAISSHDGPEIRVASRNRPDLRSAWTEVAEVVARVDAAAGAAMAGPPDLADRITIARTKPPSAEVLAELEALLAEAQAAAPPPGADLTDRALWLAAYCAEEARDALAYHRGLLACVDPSSFGSDP